jgi:hypothetical protein
VRESAKEWVAVRSWEREASWPDSFGVTVRRWRLKILRIVCGVCVLFVTLGYGHLLAHHLMGALRTDHPGVDFWAMFVPATLAGAFAVVGGVLLLMRPKA